MSPSDHLECCECVWEKILDSLHRAGGQGGAAHEDIESRKFAFGPSMNRNVGFCEQEHARDALCSAKVVKMRPNYMCACCMSRGAQHLFEKGRLVQPISTRNIEQRVLADGLSFTHHNDAILA